MDKRTLRRLVAILDAEQEEQGAGLDIAPERFLAIAAGAAPTEAETRLIMRSPLARDLLRVATCYAGAVPHAETAGGGAVVTLRPRQLAASSTAGPAATSELEIRPPEGGKLIALLKISPGPGRRIAYRLTLRLDPAGWPGGIIDGLTIRLTEPGPDGHVWLQDTTDAQGEIRATWPADIPSPAERLERLAGRGLVLRLL